MARRAPRAARAASVVAAIVATAACQGDDRPGASLVVQVAAPGRSAPAMMTEVGEPLERAVSAVPGLGHLRTVAVAEVVTLTLELRRDADVERARTAVQDALVAADQVLPPDAGVPSVSMALPPRAIELLAVPLEDAWALSPSGTRYQIDRCGQQDELVVLLDAERLRARGILGGEVVAALQRSNLTLPTGRVDPAPGGGLRRTYDDIDDLRAIVLRDGVRLDDVAELRHDLAPGCRATVDGEPTAVVTAVARRNASRPPPPLRALDGPRIHGEFAPVANATLGVPIVTAVPGTRWIAVRTDAVAGAVRIDVGVASAGATAAVTAAITAQLERQGLVGGRWTGAGAAARPKRILGAAASAPCDPRVAWPCDRVTTLGVAIDRARADQLGVDRADIATALQLYAGGVVASELVTDRDRVPVRVRYADGTARELVQVPSPNLGHLDLELMVVTSESDEPRAVLHLDRQPAIEQWPPPR